MTEPHRLTLANVLRFEHVIRQIANVDWPRQSEGTAKVMFDPAPLSANTARARLLDALLSLLSHKTVLPSLDVERLRTLRPLFYITTDDKGQVLVLPKTKKEQHQQVVPADVVAGGFTIAEPLAVLDQQTPLFRERLSAFALLLGNRDLQGQVRVVGRLPAELETLLLSNFDVAVLPDGENTILM